jgi:hypothetical protein
MPINPDPTNAVQHAIKTAIDEVVKWWRSLTSAEQSAYMASIAPQDGIEPMDSVEMHDMNRDGYLGPPVRLTPADIDGIAEAVGKRVMMENMVGTRPLSRVAGVLRDVMTDIPNRIVAEDDSLELVCDVIISKAHCINDHINSDTGQYSGLVNLAAYAIRVAEHIKREGALK